MKTLWKKFKNRFLFFFFCLLFEGPTTTIKHKYAIRDQLLTKPTNKHKHHEWWILSFSNTAALRCSLVWRFHYMSDSVGIGGKELRCACANWREKQKWNSTQHVYSTRCQNCRWAIPTDGVLLESIIDSLHDRISISLSRFYNFLSFWKFKLCEIISAYNWNKTYSLSFNRMI